MHNIISPSILSANFGNLQQDITLLNDSDAEWIHLDIMDGTFVPNLSFGTPILECVHKYSTKVLDAHMMVIDPTKYIQPLSKLGINYMTVHYEACTHLHRTIQQIKEAGMKAGVALNPHTSVALLEDVICDLDMVLIMSVNPGFSGQEFIESATQKVAKAKRMIQESGSKALIQVDGGINYETGKKVVDAGADVLVSGNFIFHSENPRETITKLAQL